MNLTNEQLQMSDDELADQIGFDTLVRLGLLNFKKQIERRQRTMAQLADEIERRGLGKLRH